LGVGYSGIFLGFFFDARNRSVSVAGF